MGSSSVLAWIGVLAGPIAWAGDVLVRYALVTPACASDSTALLRVVSFMALLVTVCGAISAWQAYQNVDHPNVRSPIRDRGRVMARLGLLSSALFALAIVAGSIPQWMLGPCR